MKGESLVSKSADSGDATVELVQAEALRVVRVDSESVKKKKEEGAIDM